MKKLIFIVLLFFIVSAIFNRVIRKLILPEIVGNIKGQELVSEENLYYEDLNEGCEYEFSEEESHFHEEIEFDRSGDLIEVQEENFLNHMSDIYLNGSEYM